MIEFILVFLVALGTAIVFMKPMTKFLYRVGIRAIDQQKFNKPLLPTSAGIVVMISFLAGVFFYTAFNTFLLQSSINLSFIFAGAFSIIIITLIGFFDDINISPGMKLDKGIKDYRIGFKQWQKPLLVLPAAIPLMAVSAGVTGMALPFIGFVNFGIIYPIILIPISVVFVSNSTNMLAGMNGLEAGLGSISLLSMGLYSILFASTEAAIISLSVAGGLLVLLVFNWYPAKILPGDSLTYLIGATMVTAAVLGNIEKFAIIIFIPWIIEFLLKLRSGFKARSLGDLRRGILIRPYKKVYSLTHLMMKLGIRSERGITTAIICLEIVFILIALMFTIGPLAPPPPKTPAI